MTKFAIAMIVLCGLVGVLFGYMNRNVDDVCKTYMGTGLEPPPPNPELPRSNSSTNQALTEVREEAEEGLDDILKRMRQNVVITKRFVRKGSVISKSDVHLRSVGFFPVYPCTELKEVIGGKPSRVDIPKGAIVYLEMF